MPAQPDPRVVHALAERVLQGRGEYQASAGQLRELFRAQIPDGPAGKSPTAAALSVRAARAELRALGIDFCRHKLINGPRVWTFRLTADPS
ncbi:hypothetical protein [Micromonospora aurantiaca (nom. illeg.)]|uniref:hypothetical protein n=1 Tax=Micromonospora aurantiaca (nom. illeg.) TaxID=47850 RepID=UPI0001BF28CF|nr:hypothetical protein [Micromonospora aurantiaca]ADL48487.1 hypothetical protein Micau_4979 [Micromonospora aurantiaca ATCC 27029]